MAGDHLEAQAGQLPDKFDVAVILERRPASNPWSEHLWEVVGVAPGAVGEGEPSKAATPISEHGDVALFKVAGFKVQLHVDECESYYHNLVSPTPRCFVIAEPDSGEGPIPFLVSLSFDEAHAYLEGEREVFAVDMPPELYRWSEAFVLRHYVPEKKKKRKLKDWREGDDGA